MTQSLDMNKPAATAGRRVYLETFGCQMNVLDSQLVRGQLLGLGYVFIDDWEQADVVLYNTCSVREHAEQKVYSRVGLVGMHKQLRPEVILGVIGCMAEREGQEIFKRYPQIDLICGPGELDKVPLLIDNAVKTGISQQGRRGGRLSALQGNTHRRSGTLAAAEDQLEMLDLSRSFSPDEHQGSAYVRITRGCNKFCTYCVVPRTRGAEVHRPPQNIIDEIKRLVDSGVIEVTLLGQTVNHYHFDHGAEVTIDGRVQPQVGAAVGPGGPRMEGRQVTRFSELLYRIHEEVPHLQRLRFVTNFPRDFGDDILQVMAQCPRICRYLHLPVQSGSNRILQLMNRGYSIEQYDQLMGRIRSYFPANQVQIASDLICGFPTETEEDHQATLALLQRSAWKNSFIFKYSPRPGTAAIERLPDDVPEEIKRRRNNELLSAQNEVSRAIHQSFVGQTLRVFVESVSAKAERRSSGGGEGNVELRWEKPEKPSLQLSGRTDGDLIVCFEGDASLVGSVVPVRVARAGTLALFGELAAQQAQASAPAAIAV